MIGQSNNFWDGFSTVIWKLALYYARIMILLLFSVTILVKDPVYMEKCCPRQEGHPLSWVNFSKNLHEKKVEPLCLNQKLAFQWQKCSCMLWSSLHDRVDPAGQAKVFIWRNIGLARRVTLPSKECDPARHITPLAEPTFCFSCKRLVKCCKEMLENLPRPG